MSIRIPVCYTHPNDPCYNNNSYECNGNVFIAPNGSNVVPPSGNAFITPIKRVNYSEGVYAESRIANTDRERNSSSDSSNKSPSRMAEKDRRRDLKKMEKKQEGGFLQKMMNIVKDPLHK